MDYDEYIKNLKDILYRYFIDHEKLYNESFSLIDDAIKKSINLSDKEIQKNYILFYSLFDEAYRFLKSNEKNLLREIENISQLFIIGDDFASSSKKLLLKIFNKIFFCNKELNFIEYLKIIFLNNKDIYNNEIKLLLEECKTINILLYNAYLEYLNFLDKNKNEVFCDECKL